MKKTGKISLHGGHSSEFCDHAADLLADIVAAYCAAGFDCLGLSEHMPALDAAWLYPDEVQRRRDVQWMAERFARYVSTARGLAAEYGERMRIFVGMESEWYPGCGPWVHDLRTRYHLDYIVGSVHHVGGLAYDFSSKMYAQAVRQFGGHPSLYAVYFDAQFDMLRALRPEVIGHFDLIRIHDPHYLATLAHPAVWSRVLRNLEWIRENGGMLDVNVRALVKGQPEAYVCAPILDEAARLGIGLAYGDDAHGVREVGVHWESVTQRLQTRGLSWAQIGPDFGVSM